MVQLLVVKITFTNEDRQKPKHKMYMDRTAIKDIKQFKEVTSNKNELICEVQYETPSQNMNETHFANEENDENWTNSQETTTRETTDTNKCAKMLKMALPHVGIALLLFFYLVMGAAVFQYVEYDADVEIQKSKLARIKQDYKKIIDEIRSLADSEGQYKAYEPKLFQTLSK
ncbi:hypothetical protein WR25_26442 [Diploscapter pachys]|uniref:Uncharacterized protein n=1 Tax=Diploscapter pachys TaxID=2018661 RepID=A0A2A2JXE2_9BILA|nr:hypothetical protein WR25_26442 [Diploscapter pachys]